MCYMAAHQLAVGVRELRQRPTLYLRRVAAGETFWVTERGRPVALLAPVPGRAGALARLLAAGRVFPAAGDLLELGPPPPTPTGVAISEALQHERAERIGAC